MPVAAFYSAPFRSATRDLSSTRFPALRLVVLRLVASHLPSLRRVFSPPVSLTESLVRRHVLALRRASAPVVAPTVGGSDDALAESEWIRRAQKGDLDAFDALVALHQNKVFNLCRWNLGNDEDAADAAQDVFVRAWKAIARFRGDCALSTWLHRIAVNVISDTANKRKRAPLPFSGLDSGDDDEQTSELEVTDVSAESNPQDAALRNAKRLAVQKALAQLPENQRAVLVLFDVQGQSYEDVAAILELPLGTVKSRLSRARLALRARLETCRELWDD